MVAPCSDLRREYEGAFKCWTGYLAFLFALLVAAALLINVPVASASTTFRWSGGAAVASRGWGNSGNWEGGLVPSSLEPVALEFPQLTSADCTASPPADTCYESENNVSGLDVESMNVETSQTYVIAGDSIMLGSGGLNAAPATNTTEQIGSIMAMPVTLRTGQTWNIAGQSSDTAIDGNQLVLLEGVSGIDQPLGINLSDGGGLVLANEDEVGPLSFEGADPSRGGILNGVVELFGAQLNVSDHQSVSFNHIFVIGTGATGPLTTDAASIAVEPGEKKAERLEVQSATFDPMSRLTFAVTNTGSEAGREYAQLTSSGLLNLEGAELVVVAAEDSCKALRPGTTYDFATSTGGLAGSFGNAGEGDEIPVTFPKGCSIAQTLQVHYERGGATQTVIATVIAGNASTTRLEVTPVSATTNETVTLLAIVSANGGEPPFGTVQFATDGMPIAACDEEPVISTATGYAATCRTSFAVVRSPHQLSAVFTPEPGINVRGSSATADLTVSQAPTTTILQSASGSFVNQSVTYAATIATPVSGLTLPSGTVQFTDGTTPIPSCAAVPLQGGDSPTIVTCQVTYPLQGEHSVTASYSGDTNFQASTSDAQTLVVKQSLEAPNLSYVPLQETEPGEATLVNTNISILANDFAEVKLACHGSTGCKGNVSLWVREAIEAKHGKKAFRSVEIGSGVFSIAPGKTASVDVHIDGTGRKLLAGHLTRIGAYLKLAQGSSKTQASVHLIKMKTARRRRPS